MLYAVLGLAIVMAFYGLGGMRSVVMTDVIQGALLLIGCLGVLVATIATLGGTGELQPLFPLTGFTGLYRKAMDPWYIRNVTFRHRRRHVSACHSTYLRR